MSNVISNNNEIIKLLPKSRTPQKNIPSEKHIREKIKQNVREFVHEKKLTPPLDTSHLQELALEFSKVYQYDELYLKYLSIIINNEVWKEQLAAIPYYKRLLLLPKCLRLEEQCPAPFDEFGLLCKTCGLCSLQDLQEEAERLGYAVLIAEGSPIIMQLIETGKIEAIVGVSCLNVLEKVNPYMEAAAIPGIAIPLLQDDCKNTNVDMDWLWDVVHLSNDDFSRRIDISAIHEQVKKWFSLNDLLSLTPNKTEIDQQAYAYVEQTGKRWRPFLAVGTYMALIKDFDLPDSDHLKHLAFSVEAFHKASLAHDDIEDNDDYRNENESLHKQFNMPIALNLGDHLIAEGYAHIERMDINAEAKIKLYQVAIDNHRTLCQGQGKELHWHLQPKKFSVNDMIELYEQKTSPAFYTAIAMGAILADADNALLRILKEFCCNLGIAYQIKDDIDDLLSSNNENDFDSQRPFLGIALIAQNSKDKDIVHYANCYLLQESLSDEESQQLKKHLTSQESIRSLEQILNTFKERAINTIRQIEDDTLKGFLRRITGKLFNELNIEGWCNEFAQKNASSH